jgi:hypothetical protein
MCYKESKIYKYYRKIRKTDSSSVEKGYKDKNKYCRKNKHKENFNK